jgi:hypothetical protein
MMDSAVAGALHGKTMDKAGEGMGEGPTAPHPFAKAEVQETTSQTRPHRTPLGPGSELQASDTQKKSGSKS